MWYLFNDRKCSIAMILSALLNFLVRDHFITIWLGYLSMTTWLSYLSVLFIFYILLIDPNRWKYLTIGCSQFFKYRNPVVVEFKLLPSILSKDFKDLWFNIRLCSVKKPFFRLVYIIKIEIEFLHETWPYFTGFLEGTVLVRWVKQLSRLNFNIETGVIILQLVIILKNKFAFS